MRRTLFAAFLALVLTAQSPLISSAQSTTSSPHGQTGASGNQGATGNQGGAGNQGGTGTQGGSVGGTLSTTEPGSIGGQAGTTGGAPYGQPGSMTGSENPRSSGTGQTSTGTSGMQSPGYAGDDDAGGFNPGWLGLLGLAGLLGLRHSRSNRTDHVTTTPR
jgi:MYXO-CTERM domain-containing protein